MPCVSCCSFPNGYLTIAPGLLSIVAYILTSISLWSCHYAETQLGLGVGLIYREKTDDDFWYMAAGNMGDGYCTGYGSYSYSTQKLDSKFKAAQGFGLSTWIVGFILVVVAWSVAPCVATPRVGWRIIGGLFFAMGCFQLFTLLILASNICSSGCKLKDGGIVAIVAFLFWWAAAAICFMIPEATEPSLPQFAPPRVVDEQVPVQHEAAATLMATETTTQRIEADGTTVVEKVATTPDGTTTVTTSIIPPAAAVAVVPAGYADANFEKR
mmetsp:Transcript_5646/g.8881  ORF Transcript_5646/g.8881 Transcript_5646/m.8881 type:complete len:269 (-) Transcript_5646:131-937(-)